MENITLEVNSRTFNKLVTDVESIKDFLFSNNPYSDYEGELSDWAINELEEARKIPNSENVTLEEVEKIILEK